MNSQTNVSLTFTLLKDKVSQNEHQSYITIKDAGGIATQRSVPINVKSVPTVSFSDPGNQTLYWNNGNPTSFQVQMTDVPQNGSVTVNITGASAFTITDANSNVLQLNGDTYTYTGGNTTFTIKPNSESTVGNSYNIGFSGSGTDLIVNSRNVQVTVNSSNSEMSATSGTIDIGQGQTSTIITLTKPTDITSINITFNSNYVEIVGSFDGNNGNYWVHSNNNATTDFTFQVKSGTPIGDYTITFTGQYSGQSVSTTATITVVNNSAPGGDEPSLPGDEIWSGSQEIDWGKDGGLSFTLDASKFSACYGKLIGLDFVRTKGKDSYQMQLKVIDSDGVEKHYNDKTSTQDDRVTMELDLTNLNPPLPEDCYLYINGVGLTLTKIYIKNSD